MSEYSKDFLMTYNSNYIEQNIDSSDFEESCSLSLTRTKNGYHSTARQEHKNERNNLLRHKNNDLTIDCDEYPIKLKNNNMTTHKINTIKFKANNVYPKNDNYRNNQINMNNKNNQQNKEIFEAKPKISLMRHRIIPCLSCIFKRSNNATKTMPVLKEKRENNYNDWCQHESPYKQIRKQNTRNNYIVQPVHAFQGNIHNNQANIHNKMRQLFVRNKTEIEKPPHDQYGKPTKNQCSGSNNLASSSESEILSEQSQHLNKKFKRRMKRAIIKEHRLYQQNRNFMTQQHQYPSKESTSPCHIYTTSIESRTQQLPTIENIPSSSSRFWDYLFEKVSRKYQRHKIYSNPKYEIRYVDSTSEDLECCRQCANRLKQNGKCCNQCTRKKNIRNKRYDGVPDDDYEPDSRQPPPSKINENNNKSKKEKKCDCDVGDNKNKHLPLDCPPEQSTVPQGFDNEGLDDKPCEDDHDEVISTLADLYNGEVLCIHSPPCVLINGCLRYAPQTGDTEVAFWPDNNTHNPYQPLHENNRKVEPPAQYIKQVKSHQYQVVVDKSTDKETTMRKNIYKSEKKIQSICHHQPPCEVVRRCKAKYDPLLENSCIHVPMCRNIPKCAIGKVQGTACSHHPRCADIPICSRNYVMLTARANIATQVMPLKAEPANSHICRHVPPCLLIPKCVGRFCDNLLPLDAIPGCMHNPPCPMVPACCRKTAKQMVSTSSQYPNSCRIV